MLVFGGVWVSVCGCCVGSLWLLLLLFLACFFIFLVLVLVVGFFCGRY